MWHPSYMITIAHTQLALPCIYSFFLGPNSPQVYYIARNWLISDKRVTHTHIHHASWSPSHHSQGVHRLRVHESLMAAWLTEHSRWEQKTTWLISATIYLVVIRAVKRNRNRAWIMDTFSCSSIWRARVRIAAFACNGMFCESFVLCIKIEKSHLYKF